MLGHPLAVDFLEVAQLGAGDLVQLLSRDVLVDFRGTLAVRAVGAAQVLGVAGARRGRGIIPTERRAVGTVRGPVTAGRAAVTLRTIIPRKRLAVPTVTKGLTLTITRRTAVTRERLPLTVTGRTAVTRERLPLTVTGRTAVIPAERLPVAVTGRTAVIPAERLPVAVARGTAITLRTIIPRKRLPLPTVTKGLTLTVTRRTAVTRERLPVATVTKRLPVSGRTVTKGLTLTIARRTAITLRTIIPRKRLPLPTVTKGLTLALTRRTAITRERLPLTVTGRTAVIPAERLPIPTVTKRLPLTIARRTAVITTAAGAVIALGTIAEGRPALGVSCGTAVIPAAGRTVTERRLTIL
ncbi:hypothetical protein GD627_10940 [Arthrobacter yangruifuii]|uniref:Uncharacterized protein n=1 Tax=Arthrobacter yangruifuii TaxID=2606616 RepID=A0A5N6MIF0_9MICC|nr:hypothetical protein [Arthrobacter yangruifuii]KAD3633320.1 hypothetical protein GD627_10940 [Arthrobacter yangruifuii]